MLKILNLLPRIPTPTVDGGAIAVFFNLMNLKKQGMDVVVAAFESNRHPQDAAMTRKEFPLYTVEADFKEYDSVSAFRNLFDSRPYNLALRFDQPRFADMLVDVKRDHPHFDVIQCDWVYMAPYVDRVKQLWPDAKLVLRQHNAEYVIFDRMAAHEPSLKNRLFLKLQTAKMKRYEAKALHWFDHVITLTDVDKELFEGLMPQGGKGIARKKTAGNHAQNSVSTGADSKQPSQAGEDTNFTGKSDSTISTGDKQDHISSLTSDLKFGRTPITTLPVGVDLDQFRRNPGAGREKRFLILGSMGWAPYVQALIWFLHHVWQDFHESCPEWKLRIVGSGAPKEILDFNGHFNVEVTGFVEDILPELHTASAMIVPLKSGSGMRVKIIEAMGAELPIITTSVGCEGIPILNERDCIIANTAEQLHLAMVDFTRRPDKGKGLSDSALQIAKNQFSWDVISRQTVELYNSL